jgi:hypothetical protein
MLTFASFMDSSQSALILDFSFQFVILRLLVCICTKFRRLLFGRPVVLVFNGNSYFCGMKGQGKIHPRTGHEGPEGE